jgi:hypothetical protein
MGSINYYFKVDLMVTIENLKNMSREDLKKVSTIELNALEVPKVLIQLIYEEKQLYCTYSSDGKIAWIKGYNWYFADPNIWSNQAKMDYLEHATWKEIRDLCIEGRDKLNHFMNLCQQEDIIRIIKWLFEKGIYTHFKDVIVNGLDFYVFEPVDDVILESDIWGFLEGIVPDKIYNSREASSLRRELDAVQFPIEIGASQQHPLIKIKSAKVTINYRYLQKPTVQDFLENLRTADKEDILEANINEFNEYWNKMETHQQGDVIRILAQVGLAFEYTNNKEKPLRSIREVVNYNNYSSNDKDAMIQFQKQEIQKLYNIIEELKMKIKGFEKDE